MLHEKIMQVYEQRIIAQTGKIFWQASKIKIGQCPFHKDTTLNVILSYRYFFFLYIRRDTKKAENSVPVDYSVSSIMISLLLATNLVIASGLSGACWSIARS